jgi:hypothetical protein
MAGLVPAIHVLLSAKKTWMPLASWHDEKLGRVVGLVAVENALERREVPLRRA